jgi:hypothetical protein
MRTSEEIDQAIEAAKAEANNEPLWFSLGERLQAAGRNAEAVDAFLRCWLLSKETNGRAMSLAYALIPNSNRDEGIPYDVLSDSWGFLADALRGKIEEMLDRGEAIPFPSSDAGHAH